MTAAPADQEQAFAAELADATENFLLLIRPAIEILRHEKKARAAAAYSRLVLAHCRRRLTDLRVPIPTHPRGVGLALHAAVLELCRSLGLSGYDLVAAHNDIIEATAALPPATPLSKIKSLIALLIDEGLIMSEAA